MQAQQPLSFAGRLLQRQQHTPGVTLPETLGVGLQGKPPLDWSLSLKSYVSLGLGLYSLLGREEASLILGQGTGMGKEIRSGTGRDPHPAHPPGVWRQGFAQFLSWSLWKFGVSSGFGVGRAHTSQDLLRNAQELRPAEDTRAVV